jgi:Ankyrin repeats (3 copies)
MNTDECFRTLEKSGWFTGWSAAALESARMTIDENQQFRDQDRFPGTAMISVWGDSECVYDEDSYTQIVNEFSNSSHGFFQPTNILEVWKDLGDGEFEITVSFESNAKSYSRVLDYQGDWLDFAISDLINEAMADGELPLRFLQPEVGFGQEFGFLLVPANLISSLIEQEILPPGEEEDEVDSEVIDMSLLAFLEVSEEYEDPDLFEDDYGKLPEHLDAFIRRDLGKFAAAVAAGADINATSSNGRLTALRIAAHDDYLEGMEWLLAQPNLDINQADQEGDTALSWAIQEGRNDRAKQLIHAGADLHFLNHEGTNLVKFATIHRNTEMAELLKEMGVS